jgi:hypothetical protein
VESIESRGATAMVLGLTQDSLGYFVPGDEWMTGRNGDYEEGVAPSAEAGDRLRDILLAMMETQEQEQQQQQQQQQQGETAGVGVEVSSSVGTPPPPLATGDGDGGGGGGGGELEAVYAAALRGNTTALRAYAAEGWR